MAGYYCSKCDGACSPCSSLELLTEAPFVGALGQPVLLHSENARRRKADPANPVLLAWCASCRSWGDTYRLTRAEILDRFIRRPGVTYRFVTRGRGNRLQELESAIATRSGREAVTLELPQRRRPAQGRAAV